jgi:hypothetical protein
MIPVALITAALEAATEALRAFNNLDPEQRKTIVDRLLSDDEKRRNAWDKFCGWISGLIAKVKV